MKEQVARKVTEGWVHATARMRLKGYTTGARHRAPCGNHPIPFLDAVGKGKTTRTGAGEGPDYKNKRELHVVLALLHLTIVGVVTTQLPKLI